MLEWEAGWVRGFFSAVAQMETDAMRGWSPEVIAAAISTAGACVVGLVGIAGAIWGTKVGAKANQAATLAAASELAEIERHRFIAERVWDERRKAYSVILTTISDAGDFWSYIDDGFSECGSNVEAFYRSDSYDRWRNMALERWWEAKRTFSENRLVFSSEFVNRFAALREAVAANDMDHDPPNEGTEMREAFRAAFKDLLAISERDVIPQVHI